MIAEKIGEYTPTMWPNTIQVRLYPEPLPVNGKVKGIAITIAPIIPPATMKNTSLLNEKSTLASDGFICSLILICAMMCECTNRSSTKRYLTQEHLLQSLSLIYL